MKASDDENTLLRPWCTQAAKSPEKHSPDAVQVGGPV